MEKWKKMQKLVGVQIHERMDARIGGKWIVPSKIQYETFQQATSILRLLRIRSSKQEKKHKSRSDNKKHKSGPINQVNLQTAGITNATAPITPTPIITSVNIMPNSICAAYSKRDDK